MPCARNVSSRSRRWALISRERSASARPERKKARSRRIKRRMVFTKYFAFGFRARLSPSDFRVEQKLVDEPGETAPTLGLLEQLTLAGLGDGVVLRVAVALGLLPRALDPALLLETNQSGIERALVQR